MSEHDLVIRAGTVIDGSGSERRTADVAVSNGVVTKGGQGPGTGHRGVVLKIDDAVLAVENYATQVAAIDNGFYTGNGSGCEEIQQAFKVERPSIRQLHCQSRRRFCHRSTSSQFAWCSVIGISERIVKSTRTTETRRDSDFRHRQRRLVYESFREMQSLRVRDCERTRTEMLIK